VFWSDTLNKAPPTYQPKGSGTMAKRYITDVVTDCRKCERMTTHKVYGLLSFPKDFLMTAICTVCQTKKELGDY